MKTISFLLILLIFLGALSCKKEDVASTKTEAPAPSAPDSAYHLNKTVLLQLVNQVRQSGCTCGTTVMAPVPVLTWNDALASAADKHSEDMLQNNYFDHTGSDGSSPGGRITAEGYIWHAYGENIAKGYADEQAVMKGWLNSEGHCMNIMGPMFREMGAARESNYWTQDLAAR